MDDGVTPQSVTSTDSHKSHDTRDSAYRDASPFPRQRDMSDDPPATIRTPVAQSAATTPLTQRMTVDQQTENQATPLANSQTSINLFSRPTDKLLFIPAPPTHIQGFLRWLHENFRPSITSGFIQTLKDNVPVKCIKNVPSFKEFAVQPANFHCQLLGPIFEHCRLELAHLQLVIYFLNTVPIHITEPGYRYSSFITFKEHSFQTIFNDFGQPQPPRYQKTSPYVKSGAYVPPHQRHHKIYTPTSPAYCDTFNETASFQGGSTRSRSSFKSSKSKKSRLSSKGNEASHHSSSQNHFNDDIPMEEEIPEDALYGDDISQISNHSTSRKLRTIFKPAKPRTKLDARLTWNGHRSTFRVYKHAIEGHLTQVGMDYLTNPKFVDEYMEKGEALFLEDGFYDKWGLSVPQAKYDIKALYGALETSNRNNYNRIIMKYASNKDGIRAWKEFKRVYANDGSAEIRVELLEAKIAPYYDPSKDGELYKYLETFQAFLMELESLSPEEYPDKRKKKLLLQKFRFVHGLKHLVQHCKDDELNYTQCANYLSENAVGYDHEQQIQGSSRRMMEVSTYQHESPSLSLTETRMMFHTMAQESNVQHTYAIFNTKTFREKLQIPEAIWAALKPEIKEEINVIRRKINKERFNTRPDNPKPPEDIILPDQYPTVNQVKANICHHVDQLTNDFQDGLDLSNDMDDGSTDDEALYDDHEDTVVHGMTVKQGVEVRAHLEYAQHSLYQDKIYAISDGGADSTIIGQNAKVIDYTGRSANLVGYDPATTRSGKIPIVSAFLKVRSSAPGGIPVLLRVNEAPYNRHSPVTLLSEYQIREYGLIIDSVATKHKGPHGKFGTQRLQISELLHIPFEDRGGLMGFELLPIEEGDENKYDIFTITTSRTLP